MIHGTAKKLTSGEIICFSFRLICGNTQKYMPFNKCSSFGISASP